MAEKDHPLFIKELIRRVHDELVESETERVKKNQAALFEVGELTLEVNFVVSESSAAKGGLDFKIIPVGGVDVGGEKAFQQSQVHKITLTLNAVQLPSNGKTGKAADGKLQISGKRPARGFAPPPSKR